MVRYIKPTKMDQNIVIIYKHALKYKKKLRSIKFMRNIIEVVLIWDGFDTSVLLYPSERNVEGARHGEVLTERESVVERLKWRLKI